MSSRVVTKEVEKPRRMAARRNEGWKEAAKEARRMIGSTTVDVSKWERTMATRRMVWRIGAKTAKAANLAVKAANVVMMDCSRAP